MSSNKVSFEMDGEVAVLTVNGERAEKVGVLFDTKTDDMYQSIQSAVKLSSNTKKEKECMTSTEVFNLDSFKALCRDVGIDSTLPIENLTITLNLDDVAKINIDYLACKEVE